MYREEFLNELSAKLAGLPKEEVEERLSFYGEMIDDRMEDGVPESEAVAQIGTPEEIAEQIMSEIPLTRLVKEKVADRRRKSSGKRKTWKTVLLIVGSPVWGALLIAGLAVVLALYVSLWAVVVSLWAVFAALAVSAVACLPASVIALVRGNPLAALGSFGAAFACAGLAILMFFACVAITKGVVKLTKKMMLKLKSAFIRKEA